MATDETSRVVVRVRAPAGFIAGAGMLLSGDVVATCAHVVGDALGHDDVPEERPTAAVELDLPFVTPGEVRRAHVFRWLPPLRDGSGDIALLRLEEPVAVAVPAFRRVGELWDRPFRVAGFPPDHEDGVWTSGALRAVQGSGWIQLTGAEEVGPGFSGAPIWDDRDDVVVAMAVAADRGWGPNRSAYALPIVQVIAEAPELLTNPYRGLAAFRDSDSEFFFGRQDEVDRAMSVLGREGLLALVGSSGAGKSSLLAAGIVPAARAQGRQVAHVRFTATSSRADVVATLAAALASVSDDVEDGPAAAKERRGARGWTADRWARLLEDDPDRSTMVVSGTSRSSPGPSTRTRVGSALSAATASAIARARLMLVLDQLEDLAAVAPDAARVAVELVEVLVAAGVWVALTARWATVDEVTLGRSAPVLQRAVVGITPLGREALRAAIAEPAARLPGPAFDPELVARIVDDAADEPGRLPLVAALLAELWDAREDGQLTVEAYRRVGAVEGALVGGAERTWSRIAVESQPAARTLMMAMVRPSESGFLRGAVPLASLDAGQRRLVEFLAAARLVVIGPRAEGDVAELAHQSLIDWWPRLRRWLSVDAEFLQWRAELQAARQRWDSRRDPDTLLRGVGLAAAQSWVTTRGEDLTADELAFVAASAHRRQRTRVLRVAIVAVAALAVLAVLVVGVVVAMRIGSCSLADPVGSAAPVLLVRIVATS